MDQFDDVSLDYFPKTDLAGLIDTVEHRVTPVRGARVVTSGVSGAYRLTVVDDVQKEFHYRQVVGDMETAHHLAAVFQARFDEAAGRVANSTLVVVTTASHQSSAGVTWNVTLRRRLLPTSHDYWMYSIQCEVEDHFPVGFIVMVKKDKVDTIESAERILISEVLESALGLIDHLPAGERRALSITQGPRGEWVMI